MLHEILHLTLIYTYCFFVFCLLQKISHFSCISNLQQKKKNERRKLKNRDSYNKGFINIIIYFMINVKNKIISLLDYN
jgi:hypothetical protein